MRRNPIIERFPSFEGAVEISLHLIGERLFCQTQKGDKVIRRVKRQAV